MRVCRAVQVLSRVGVVVCLTFVCLTYVGAPTPLSAQASPDPAAILSAARAAIGGETQIAAIKTLVVSGRTRQVRGDNLVPIEFEISCELPDKYIRRDEIPAQENGPTTTGFSGDALIQVPPLPSPPARAGAPAPTPAQLDSARSARTTALKQDFARLMLGLFAESYASYPLTFSYFGTAEAPQGQADVLDVKGPGNFTARFFVYKNTHLPVMLSWQGSSAGAGRGLPGRGVPPPGAAAASAPPGGAAASPPETRLYFADYRDVDGLKLPFRIRRAVGSDTVEETTFDRFRINPKIDPRKFEVK